MGHPCGGRVVLAATAPARPLSALPWKIARPLRGLPQLHLVLSFLSVAARSGAEMQMDEKRLVFAWPFSDSCRPRVVTQTLQHGVQAAHSPVTSPACPPRDTLCFCPDKPLASPHFVPLLGVPSLSCFCASSALQNPAVFTTPPPPPKKQTFIYLVTGYYIKGL